MSKEHNDKLCDNCQIHPIKMKDYRDIDGMSSKIYSCEYCACLNGEWHYRVRAENLCPKDVLEEKCECELCKEDDE